MTKAQMNPLFSIDALINLRNPIDQNNQLYPMNTASKVRKYAFRIGFVGGLVDRYDKDLLGMVIDAETFEPFVDNPKTKATSTLQAKKILFRANSKKYPVERQRLVHAALTGATAEDRRKSLGSAIHWLETRGIDVIYFQYPWMVSLLMKGALGKPCKPMRTFGTRPFS